MKNNNMKVVEFKEVVNPFQSPYERSDKSMKLYL